MNGEVHAMDVWWLWLTALALAGWSAKRARRGTHLARMARYLVVLLAFFPVAWPVSRGLVTWLYRAAPSPWAQALMPSRGVLPLTHYQARLAQAWNWTLGIVAALAGLGALTLAVRTSRGRALRHHPLTRAAGYSLALALLAFVGYNLWLEIQFRRPHPVFYTDCRKVWGHRGHPEPPDIPENTLASYTRAFDLGAPGVEMDVRYDPARREYFIGRYDRGQVPPPGQRLLLADVFAVLGPRGHFWLDIKTIAYLSPAQAHQAAADLRALVDHYSVRERVIVESSAPERLMAFAQAGLHTSYWVFNRDEDAFPATPWALWWELARVKHTYIRGGFSAISMDRRFYRPMVAWMLRGARIHLFTVDEEKALRDLVARPEVRIVLTNTARYDITACP